MIERTKENLASGYGNATGRGGGVDYWACCIGAGVREFRNASGYGSGEWRGGGAIDVDGLSCGLVLAPWVASAVVGACDGWGVGYGDEQGDDDATGGVED